jgi:hypothetical protein
MIAGIVGIDNGVSGGLAYLENGKVRATLPMPTVKARKGNEIDVYAVDRFLFVTSPRLVVIEEPGGSKSARAATSMAGSFHALRTICVVRGIPYERITPQIWQKVMLPGCKAGETKQRALEAAKRLWPEADWRGTERSKVPHDGLIDAALIAMWAIRAGYLNDLTVRPAQESQLSLVGPDEPEA